MVADEMAIDVPEVRERANSRKLLKLCRLCNFFYSVFMVQLEVGLRFRRSYYHA
jgi:hypothetical protein